MLPTLSLVLPCFNEEKNIEDTVREAFAWFAEEGIRGEVIVVNDGSSDRTVDVLDDLQKEFPLIVITHACNMGYGTALCSGCDRATMDYIAFMDSDGQFHASDFHLLIPQLSHADFVSGVRLRRADPFVRSLNARLYGFLIRWMLGVRVRDINCAMKIFRRSLWMAIRPRIVTGALFNAELFLRLSMMHVHWQQIPVPHYPRLLGEPTGAKISVIIRMFRELWKLRRAKPLLFQELLPLRNSRNEDPKGAGAIAAPRRHPSAVRSR